MAKYTGYVTIPHGTYTEWRNAVNGNFYDADQLYGCQCMDLAMEFWYNVGFPQAYPHTSTGNADGVWSLRSENLSYMGTTYFQTINDINDVLEGDIICYNSSPYGHIGFANINYQDWVPDPEHPNEFPILSQNNGGTPDPSGEGTNVNIAGYDISYFQGAFRYLPWHATPPQPGYDRRSNFPWVLYARKLRENM